MGGGNHPNDINTWVNWSITFNNTTKKRIIYKNGVNVGEGTANVSSYNPTTHNYRIGGFYVNSTLKYFNGYIDDLEYMKPIYQHHNYKNYIMDEFEYLVIILAQVVVVVVIPI